MKKIVYIGNRELKEDNIAGTGLVWTRGQIHEVSDEKKAAMLLGHPDVWADGEKEFTLKPLAQDVSSTPAPLPRVEIIPQGGEKASPFWEPITIPVPAETFNRVRDKELEVVFMTSDDAESFKAWKEKNIAQAARMREAKAAKHGLTA